MAKPWAERSDVSREYHSTRRYVLRVAYESRGGEVLVTESPPVFYSQARQWQKRFRNADVLYTEITNTHTTKRRVRAVPHRLVPLLTSPPSRIE